LRPLPCLQLGQQPVAEPAKVIGAWKIHVLIVKPAINSHISDVIPGADFRPRNISRRVLVEFCGLHFALPHELNIR